MLENKMLIDSYWDDYETEEKDEEAYLEYLDAQLDQARGK